jgi:hypothetical protein
LTRVTTKAEFNSAVESEPYTSPSSVQVRVVSVFNDLNLEMLMRQIGFGSRDGCHGYSMET